MNNLKPKPKAQAHIRHAGLMIDASFRRDGTVAYYCVERCPGAYLSLNVAKEIAEGKARQIKEHLAENIRLHS